MELIHFLLALAIIFIFCKEASIVILLLALVSMILAYIYTDNTFIIVPIEDNYLKQVMRNNDPTTVNGVTSNGNTTNAVPNY